MHSLGLARGPGDFSELKTAQEFSRRNPTRKQKNGPFLIRGRASLEKTHFLRLINILHAFLLEGKPVGPPVSQFEVSGGLRLATSSRSLMA